MAAAWAGGTGDGAAATADFDPTSAWGNDDAAAAAHRGFDPTPVRNKHLITKRLPILSTSLRAILCFHPHEVAHTD